MLIRPVTHGQCLQTLNQVDEEEEEEDEENAYVHSVSFIQMVNLQRGRMTIR